MTRIPLLGAPHSNPRRFAAAVALVSLLTSVMVVLGYREHCRELARTRFDALARDVTMRVAQRFGMYEYGLLGSRGAALAVGFAGLSAEQYRTYAHSRNLAHEFPGARGMGIIRRVPQREEAAFLAAAGQDRGSALQLRQLTPHDGDRYIIQYIEPLELNAAALGLDIASERLRREAAEAAAATGNTTLTGPIRLVQTGPSQWGFLLLLPIYGSEISQPTAEARRAALAGWAFAPLAAEDVLSDFQVEECALLLSDTREPELGPFFATPGFERPAAAGLALQMPMQVFGRSWLAELRATPAFLARLNLLSPGLLVLLAAGVSALLTALGYVYAVGLQRREQVRAEQARHAAIVAGSQDAVIGEAFDGLVTDWNEGAARMFGYSREQALNRPLLSLIVPAERAGEDVQLRAAVARRELPPIFDTTRCHADGTAIEVSLSVAPIVAADGRWLGLSKTIRDISAARRAERQVKALNTSLERMVGEHAAALEAARRDLKSILDAVPSLVGYWDRNLEIRFANLAHEAWFGLPASALPGTSAAQLFQSARDVILPRLQLAWSGAPQTFDVELPGAAGTRLGTVHLVPDLVDGHARGTYVFVHDETAQRQARDQLAAALREKEALLGAARLAEAELQEAHARMALATDAANIGVWDLDVVRQQLTCDAWMYRLYGYDPGAGKLPRSVWQESVVAEDRARTTAELARVLATGRTFDTEFRITRVDGQLRHIKMVANVVRDDAGRPLRVTGINFDITERKRSELELLATSSLLRNVLEAASEVALIATDAQLVIKVFNRGAERLLGYRAAELIDRATPLVFHDSAELTALARELSARSGELVEPNGALRHPLALAQPREWMYVRKGGSLVPVSLVMTAMRAADGELFGYLGVARDVTSQRHHEATLREATRRAEQASRAKSEFLANMSHEIRTPLHAVIGLSYLLEKTSLDAEQAGLLAKVQGASKSLLSLIDDVLDLSKIEANELQLEQAPFALSELLVELREMYILQARAKGLAFRMVLPPTLPSRVAGDATRLKQILNNLLSNAIKFTELGGVELRVLVAQDTGTTASLRFEVADTGIGISEEEQARLFEPFAQADASTTRRFGGTGLGLSIVKRLAQLMGGAVGVDSSPNVGSIFWVELPLSASAAVSERAEAAALAPSIQGVRVLVVDDSDINLFVARRVLERGGARVLSARNGEEALDTLRADARCVDIVLMDIQMPGVDGHEAARLIREELGLKQLPIIALTADARTSERQQARRSGMNELLSKPLEPARLFQCIHRLLGARPAAPGLAPAQPPAAAERDGEWPAIAGIDMREVRLRLRADRALFEHMLARFVETEAQAPELRADATREQLEEYRAKVHRLRGSAGNLGAKALFALGARIERHCRAGELEAVRELAPDFSRAVRELCQAISASQQLPAARAASVPAADATEAATLNRLLALLADQDLAAIDEALRVAPLVATTLGDEGFQRFRRHVDRLEFTEAVSLFSTSPS